MTDDFIKEPGIDPASLMGKLTRVPVHQNKEPIKSFDPWSCFTDKQCCLIRSRYAGDRDVPFQEIQSRLPLVILKKLSFDQLCKVRHSSIIMLKYEVEELYHAESPQHMLFAKIVNSAWRWGVHRMGWNEVVDAWNGLALFDLGVKDLRVEIDHTTGCNKYGYSHYGNVFLDAVLAFHVYQGTQRLMTLGFSFTGGKKLLLRQVQLSKCTGNRWLFKLPANRLEFILDRFRLAFPKHKICVADGEELGEFNLQSYTKALEVTQERIDRVQTKIEQKEDDPYDHVCLAEYLDKEEELRGKISHISNDIPRLAAFYKDVGHYRLGSPITVNLSKHYPVLPL